MKRPSLLYPIFVPCKVTLVKCFESFRETPSQALGKFLEWVRGNAALERHQFCCFNSPAPPRSASHLSIMWGTRTEWRLKTDIEGVTSEGPVLCCVLLQWSLDVSSQLPAPAWPPVCSRQPSEPLIDVLITQPQLSPCLPCLISPDWAGSDSSQPGWPVPGTRTLSPSS